MAEHPESINRLWKAKIEKAIKYFEDEANRHYRYAKIDKRDKDNLNYQQGEGNGYYNSAEYLKKLF